MLGALTALVVCAPASAQVTLTRVGDFVQPTYVTAPPGDGRLFVVERGEGPAASRIQVVRDGVQTTFLDLSDRVSAGGERGLFSMAFAPDYATSGRFWVFYTGAPPFVPATGDLQIDEYRRSAADPDVADPATRRPVLTVPHDRCANHNGGQLQVGPDGMLYAGTGDGGGGNDPNDNGQRLAGADRAAASCGNHPLLGKLLRLDPSGAPAAGNPFGGEAAAVWSLGLRNPWRFSFDRATGDLTIGDVGQGAVEEVDFVAAAAGRGSGANFGWSVFEGDAAGPRTGQPLNPRSPAHTAPVVTHTHASGWCSITGGYVVRDPGLPELAGQYVYGDYCLGRLFAADLGTGATRDLGLPSVSSLASFGEDACGRVHVASLDGPVQRLGTSGCALGAPPRPAPAGGPGAPGGAQVAVDRRPPVLRLSAARRQRVSRKGYVAARVRCDEPCALRLSGVLRVGARRLRLRRVDSALAAGRVVTLRVKFTRASRRAFRLGLRRRQPVRFVLTAGAYDAARNAVRRTAVVRQRRRSSMAAALAPLALSDAGRSSSPTAR
jgi:glucose/arabinose dehydrogenase